MQAAWQQAMDRMLAGFVQWATAVKHTLGAQHFWCDAIDPLTGCPLVRHRCSMHSSGFFESAKNTVQHRCVQSA